MKLESNEAMILVQAAALTMYRIGLAAPTGEVRCAANEAYEHCRAVLEMVSTASLERLDAALPND